MWILLHKQPWPIYYSLLITNIDYCIEIFNLMYSFQKWVELDLDKCNVFQFTQQMCRLQWLNFGNQWPFWLLCIVVNPVAVYWQHLKKCTDTTLLTDTSVIFASILQIQCITTLIKHCLNWRRIVSTSDKSWLNQNWQISPIYTKKIDDMIVWITYFLILMRRGL